MSGILFFKFRQLSLSTGRLSDKKFQLYKKFFKKIAQLNVCRLSGSLSRSIIPRHKTAFVCQRSQISDLWQAHTFLFTKTQDDTSVMSPQTNR